MLMGTPDVPPAGEEVVPGLSWRVGCENASETSAARATGGSIARHGDHPCTTPMAQDVPVTLFDDLADPPRRRRSCSPSTAPATR